MDLEKCIQRSQEAFLPRRNWRKNTSTRALNLRIFCWRSSSRRTAWSRRS